MILQNFLLLFNFCYLFCFSILLFVLNKFFLEINIRKKFFLFLIIFFFFMCIGLYYNLDGIIMLFVISELSVLLIFITMFSQLYSFNTKTNKMSSFFIFFSLLGLNFSFFNTKVLSYCNFYSYFNVTLNDFYYIYNYYFEKQILVTLLIMFIITLYSIFFILLYFSIKKKQNIEQTKINSLSLLRKQNILHQSNYSPTTRTFQKL
jgi:hypothetical protein